MKHLLYLTEKFFKIASNYSWSNPVFTESVQNDPDHELYDKFEKHHRFWSEEDEDDFEWHDERFDKINGKSYNPNYLTNKKINDDKKELLINNIKECLYSISYYLVFLKTNVISYYEDNNLANTLTQIFNKYYDNINEQSNKIDEETNLSIFYLDDCVDLIKDFLKDLVVSNQIIMYQEKNIKNDEDKQLISRIKSETNDTINELKKIILEFKKSIIETREERKEREKYEKQMNDVEQEAGEIDWRPTETIPEDHYAL